MNKLKKIGALLSSAMLMTALAGCSTEKSDGAGSASSTAAAEQSKQPIKMETIRVWTNSGHTKELVTEMVGEYNSTIGKEKGIKIEYTVQGADYKQAIDLALASGQAPELFYVVGPKVDYVKRGDIIPIEELPRGKEFLGKYDGMLNRVAFTVKGKAYSVPFNITNVKLLYNKDLFKKAGLVDKNGEAKPPKTWTEVREYAKKLTNPQDKVYGIALPLKWGSYFDWELLFPWVSSIGHNSFNTLTGKYEFSSFKPALEWLMSIKEDKSYFPGPEGLDNDPARAQFSEGRVAMKLGASWDVGVLNDQLPATMDWGAADIPVSDPANRYKEFASVSDFISVSKTAKSANLEKVMEVYKWLNSDEFLVKMYEEGKYVPYDNRIIQMAKKLPKAKGWADFGHNEKIYLHHGQPTVKLEGNTHTQVFLKIWMGGVGIEEALADLDARYNAALDAGVKDGTIDKSMFVNENFDFRLK